ncbi:MAG: SphA family protein [Thermodesulfobacteriota bacterium]
MMQGNRKRLSLLCGLAGMLTATVAQAGGGQSYPNGAEAFMAGAAPPPGFYFLDYAYHYSADTMKDNAGNSVAAFDEVSVWANVFRFLWMSDKTILGATYGQHLFVPVLSTDLSFKAAVGPRATRDYDDSGVPYLIYSPMVLSWHLIEGKLHIAATPADIYIPTGQDDGNMATVGHNFWTFEPVVAVTWMTGGWEFSGKFMYDFNTSQDKYATVYGFNVDRDPGQEFHFDYSASYAVMPNLRLGVSGYYYTQTTDDSYDLNTSIPAPVQDLLRADEGSHSRVFAMGPGLWYNHKNMFFELRNQYEMAAENKTEGYNLWLKFTYAF